MKQKDDLFHLIKSMSRSEKRYFTLEAKRAGTGTAKYLDLFKRINDMEEYDESLLHKKFPRNLSASKSFLYDVLMKSMRDYARGHAYSVKMQERIQDFKILYQRGLYDQAEDRLIEAKQLAHELDDQMAILEINYQERLLSWYKKEDFFSRIQELSAETAQAKAKLMEEYTYLDLNYKIIAEYKKGLGTYDKSFKENIIKAYKVQLIDQPVPDSWRAKYRYYSSLAVYYKYMADKKQTIYYYKKVLDCWQALEKLKEEDFFRYLVDVSNLMAAYFQAQGYDNLIELIQDIEKEKSDSSEEKGIIFTVTSIYKVLVYINTGQQVDVEKLGNELEAGLKDHKINEGSKLVLLFNFALYCFLCEKFTLAASWCEKIIRKRDKRDIRKDIHIAAYLLNLMSTFEFAEDEIIENTFRSTQRFLKSWELFQDSTFENSLYHIVRKMFLSPINDLRTIYVEAQTYFKGSMEDDQRKAPLDLDELCLWWIQSKLDRKFIIEYAAQSARASIVRFPRKYKE